MDDWHEIKGSLLTPEGLSQPAGDKVLCLSHWKTISSAPILVSPAHLGIWDLLPVWTSQKKEQQKGVYSGERRKSHPPFHTHLANSSHCRLQWRSLWGVRGIGHTPSYWFLVSPQDVFSAGDYPPPLDYELLESRNPSSPSHCCLMGALSASLVPGRTGAP